MELTNFELQFIESLEVGSTPAKCVTVERTCVGASFRTERAHGGRRWKLKENVVSAQHAQYLVSISSEKPSEPEIRFYGKLSCEFEALV